MTNATPISGLEHIDPRTLELDPNVRSDVKLSKAFKASIKEHGVLVPITAVRDYIGAPVRVRTGQRRVLAAREAGLKTIPVYLLNTVEDTAAERVSSVIEQIVENDHRAELSDVERVFGIQQLFDADLSVTKISKALSVPAAKVKAAKAVTESQTAIDKLAAGQLTLEQAAVIAEFDGDEDAVQRLMDCTGNSWRAQHFDQEASRLREQRAHAAAEEAAIAGYVEAGFTVLDDRPDAFDPRCVPLHQLLDGDAQASVEAVKNAAEWAVYVTEDYCYIDIDTGDVIDEDLVDWNTQGKPDATPDTVTDEEGHDVVLRHADKVKEASGFIPEYYCLDFTAAGLTPTERFTNLAGKNRVAEVANEDLTEDQIAAKRADEAQAKVDAESRERRKVLALNRLGQAAENVRRTFVKAMLSRKTAPKGAALFVAQTLARDPFLLTTNKASETTAELLGVEHISGYSSRVEKGVEKLFAGANDGRAQVITLALVLGAMEARTPKDAWRSGGARWSAADSKPYLEFLAANGYVLAEIEEVVTGKRKADKVFDAL